MSKVSGSAAELFEQVLPSLLQVYMQKAKEIGGVYAFELAGEGGGTWTIDLSIEQPKVLQGLQSNVECSIIMDHSDFVQLLADTSLVMPLFMKGKIKVKGNPMHAMKIQKLFALASP